MNLRIEPASILKGSIRLPSSKSYSIRAFIISSLGGKSSIINPSDCEDVQAARLAGKRLGACISGSENNTWLVKGINQDYRFPAVINVGESGTTLRFLLSLLTLTSKRIRVEGRGTLLNRPNHYLVKVLNAHGARIKGRGKKQCLPLVINPGNLRGKTLKIDGTLSSQFISSLLITCPSLKQDSLVKIKGRYVVSRPYIEMTLRVLRKAGIKISSRNQRQYFIKGGQRFRGLRKFIVPDDYGLTAFFMVATCLLKSKVVLLRNSKDDLVQADKDIICLLRKMGARIKIGSRNITVQGPQRLKGGDFCLRDCPDLTPIMAIAALFAKGKTRLYGISHVRSKESDRISDLRRELLKIGAEIRETRDSLFISPLHRLRSDFRLNPHQDHRLAMAFCILGLKVGGIVEDVECIAKSYPGFVKDLRRIKGRFRQV